LLNPQNNYVERLSTDNMIILKKSFKIPACSLNVLHNYLDGPNKKLFSNLYPNLY